MRVQVHWHETPRKWSLQRPPPDDVERSDHLAAGSWTTGSSNDQLLPLCLLGSCYSSIDANPILKPWGLSVVAASNTLSIMSWRRTQPRAYREVSRKCPVGTSVRR